MKMGAETHPALWRKSGIRDYIWPKCGRCECRVSHVIASFKRYRMDFYQIIEIFVYSLLIETLSSRSLSSSHRSIRIGSKLVGMSVHCNREIFENVGRRIGLSFITVAWYGVLSSRKRSNRIRPICWKKTGRYNCIQECWRFCIYDKTFNVGAGIFSNNSIRSSYWFWASNSFPTGPSHSFNKGKAIQFRSANCRCNWKRRRLFSSEYCFFLTIVFFFH